MDWKARAIQAAHEKAAQDLVDQQRREEAEHARQVETFGVKLRQLLGEDIAVEALDVTVNGITFGWQRSLYGMERSIVVRGTCPKCNGVAWSDAVGSLARLGALLEGFSPGQNHVASCSDRRQRPH